ncbi:hypothetical protein BOW53_04245 [Solemya pervernicosa gill symbiont]|uniref:Pilus assembly protein PilE n=2 Tax=Gammaproteobacteria incertae sedis TaxID=118884 RepID=A0A1T2L8C0_9GAMM|nr:type IV pilin protein [Candidatus Reidiella endopervernicosa]OOZ41333.1 hypothetical protein BOW53_04245 [Solemya pervernicosa gill symbiont]QKQ27709.1 prepilin-type N-terminal cleavage/methylation domain-containing protein [Candidatus Reidiella endopervernicosa]
MKKNSGFTLIELMIVVAIVAILMTFAYPMYTDYIREAKRGEGRAALLQVQLEQEKWRANNTTYGTLANIGVNSNVTTDGGDLVYTLAVSGNDSTRYTATLTGQGTQAADSGCTSLTLTVNPTLPTGLYAPTTCFD